MSQAATEGTRDRMLEAAITLMRRSGWSGAGINEIARESGAPKGSIYHYFPDGKQQIVKEALEQYSARVVEFIDSTLSTQRDPRKKVKALFNGFAKRLEAGEFRLSCPAGTVCLDLDLELEALRPVVAGAFDQYLDAIAVHFPFKDRQRTRLVAGLLLTAIEGAYIRGRANRSGDPFREAGALLSELVG